ncbi:MAG: mannitol dehydrogenase family protein [Aeromicrobium sp.]
MTIDLRSANLDQLPAGVQVPAYDPDAVEAGIVHIGVGGFHRSHLAVYVDDLLADGHSSWGIRGIGLMPSDRTMNEVLTAQDHLYTVVTMPRTGPRELRVVGSIVDHLLTEDDLEAVIESMAAPATRIISLTVTEGGYFQRPDRSFDDTDDAIVADVADPGHPRTAFGVIVAALDRRRQRELPSVTVMSCDNLPGNGGATRAAVLGTAALIDPALHDWIAEHTTFPSSMVDRITPATTPELIASIEADPGIVDRWPVPAEPFTQWILEDEFVAGRPPFETVGAQLVDDVAPYELMKLRLLNGAHQVIAHLGIPAGYRLVHEALADDELLGTVRAYLDDEAKPTLSPVPGVDVDDYIETLLDRFANPSIADTLERLATDTHNRLKQFVVPVVRDRAAAGLESPIALRVLEAAGFPLDEVPTPS